MTRTVAVWIALASLLVLTGCGDQALWTRWRAERDLWHARRDVERLQLNPRLATDRDYAGAESRFAEIAERYPASRWGRAGLPPVEHDVGLVSGRAAIAAARIEELRGRAAEALGSYARIERDYAGVTPVALDATVSSARLLGRAGREREALEAWARASGFPLVDAASGEPFLPVPDAALRVAAARRAAGDPAGADSVLAVSERRIERELMRRRGKRAAPELWTRLSDTRAARGHWDSSLDALRAALSDSASNRVAPWIVLALARRSLEAGRPDSALVYTSWAEHGFDEIVRPGAILLSAKVWEARGTIDSALVAYRRFLEAYSDAPHASAEAMFRRGVLFEGQGRWEQARTEFRALAAEQPTDSLGLEALTRIVRHHADRGEKDLAAREGKRALETVDQLIATQRDETVQSNVRRTRADILVAMGDAAAACDALVDLWRRYPTTAIGIGAALRGADLAENQLNDRNRAIMLYREVAEKSRDADARRRANAALTRLGAERS